jgi:serine/threonine-protein kinase
MPLVSGAMAAGFSIVRPLGCGQIGELYLVEHPRLPRRHALEILPVDLSADPEYRERFNRESDLAAALWHPHIVSLHDRGESEGQLWLSMDYVDGADAAQLLTDTYPDGMPPDAAVQIVSAIADALDYAHDHGLLHRYVKPSNILITDRRRILLAGFGVAQRLDDINSLTQTNKTAGTVSYAAPEQLMGDSIDGRADQYALAGTAFHLLTGSPPFAHTNPAVVIGKHLSEPPPRLGDVRPELAYLSEPFARALAKAPGDRFPRCQDFAKALEASYSKRSDLQDDEPTAAVTQPVPSQLSERPPAAAIPRNGKPDVVAPTKPAVPAPRHVEAEDASAPTDVLPRPGIADVMASPVMASPVTTSPAAAPPAAASPIAAPSVTASPVAASPAPPLPTVPGATTDSAWVTLDHRQLRLKVGLALTIMIVVLVGFLIVMALRSASESHDAPSKIETSTPSSRTAIPPAPAAPATATPSPAVIAPAPMTTKAPTSTPPPPAATAWPTSTQSLPEAITPLITKPPSSSRTTPAPPVDSRPAVGMPCSQTGSTAVSNSGVPINCVETPGGFAWESGG